MKTWDKSCMLKILTKRNIGTLKPSTESKFCLLSLRERYLTCCYLSVTLSRCLWAWKLIWTLVGKNAVLISCILNCCYFLFSLWFLANIKELLDLAKDEKVRLQLEDLFLLTYLLIIHSGCLAWISWMDSKTNPISVEEEAQVKTYKTTVAINVFYQSSNVDKFG